MSTQLFDRIAHGLKEQHRNLLGWLNSAGAEDRAIRLGPQPVTELKKHLQVLETAICCAEENTLGTCTVCHEPVETHLLETNYTASVCIEHLTGEERNRLEAELELSQKVQKGLLPQELPELPGWELAAFSQPASIVGGDYFDVLRFRDGSRGLIIADVMGKGLPASLLMASLQASLRIILPECDRPEEALLRLNRIFHHNINLTKFVSIVIIHLDPATGKVAYANAGHHPPYVVRGPGAEGEILIPLRPTGAAIGLAEDATFTGSEAVLGEGDQLVLYTDGFVEAMTDRREEYGDERFRTFLLRSRDLTPSNLIRGLRSEIHSFTGGFPPADDMTILACRRRGK